MATWYGIISGLPQGRIGESKMPGLEDPESGASPTGQMAAATQAGLGGLLPFYLQSFFFYKQYIQLCGVMILMVAGDYVQRGDSWAAVWSEVFPHPIITF